MLMTVVALTVTQIVPSLAPAFSGPVTVGSSGAAVPRSALTIGYPAQGVTYDVPLLAASQTHYSVDRPHKHTYPAGFTLQYVAFYSSAYAGHHWAIYDQAHTFYAYDNGDVTEGDYDYDESDDLPLGCEYSDEHLSTSTGALHLPSTFDVGRAPSLAPSPSTASAESITAAQQPGAVIRTSVSAADSSEAVTRILCKPMPARSEPLLQSLAAQQSQAGGGGAAPKLSDEQTGLIILWGGLGGFFILICCIVGCCEKGDGGPRENGGPRGHGGGSSGVATGYPIGYLTSPGGDAGGGHHGGHCSGGDGGCGGGDGGGGGGGGGGD